MKLVSTFYNNPDYYPPMLRSAELFEEHGITQEILACRVLLDILPHVEHKYPQSTVVKRVGIDTGHGARSFLAFFLAAWRASDAGADLFIGYDMHGFFTARLLSWRHRRPVIYHIHDYAQWSDVGFGGRRIAKLFEWIFARTADVVIVPDSARAAVIEKDLHLTEPPLIVANSELMPPPPSTALRDVLNSRGTSYSKIVWRQGRIGPGHGLEVTLKSLPLWADPSWGFVIMGPGDLAYKESLRGLAKELGVLERFEVLPAVGLHRDVAQFTVGAALGHCIYEDNGINNRFMTTASNKTMEYIAAGLPVLLSESTGSRSLLARYKLGMTADESSPESIAHAINTILTSEQLMQSMQAESRRAFEEEFNYRHQYAPVLEAFSRLTRQKAARSDAKHPRSS